MSPRQQSARHRPDIVLPTSYNDLPFTQIQTRHYEKELSVIILTLHRPKNHNAFTDTMRAEIESAYAMFDADERVKCIVVTGSGRIFCAGADLGIGFGEGTSGDEAEKVQDHRDGCVALRCSFQKANAVLTHMQWRPRNPEHLPLPQAHHWRFAGLCSRDRHHHDAADEHTDCVPGRENRICVLAPRACHGGVLLVLLAPACRAQSRHAGDYHGRDVPCRGQGVGWLVQRSGR
jgi:hypothetical protein